MDESDDDIDIEGEDGWSGMGSIEFGVSLMFGLWGGMKAAVRA